MKICRNCSFNNPDTANYCGGCGHSLGTPMKLMPETEYLGYKKEIDKLNSQVESLNSSVTSLQGQLEGQKGSTDRLRRELDKERANAVSLVKQLDMQDGIIESLKQDLDREKSNVNRLTIENEELKAMLENCWWNKLKKWWEKALEWSKETFTSMAGEIISLLIVAIIYVISDKIPSCTSSKSETGLEIISDSNGKWGIYDHDADSTALACQYDSIRMNQNYYQLYSDGKLTIADDKGHLSVATPVDQLYPIGYGGVRIYSNGKQGLMDDHGNLLVPCEYNQVYWYNNSTYPSERTSARGGNIIPVKISKDGNWLLLNRQGKLITNTNYFDVKLLSAPDLMAVKLNANAPWTLINSKGESRNTKYSNVDVFYSDLAIARVWSDKSWVAVDLDGKEIWRKAGGGYDFVDHYSDGVCAAIKYSNNQITYLDKGGHPIFDKKYYRIYNQKDRTYADCAFYDGRAYVSDGRRTGYIDKKGNFTPEEK